MLPAMRASDARIQDAKTPLQKSNLLGLLAKDLGSVSAFSDGEYRRMSSASAFYQKKHHQSTTPSATTKKKRAIAPTQVRRRREKMKITWLPISRIHFQ